MSGILGTLVVWQTIAWLRLFNPIYFASPYEVCREFVQMALDGMIFLEIAVTLERIFSSVLISALIGIPVAVVLGYYYRFYQVIGKVFDFLRSIPPIVAYPLLLIVLGPGDESRIGVAVFGSTIVLILIIAKGLSQHSLLRRQFNKAHGASRIQIMVHTVLFEALPHIMVGLRTAVSLSIIVVIVTEMLVGAEYGLGTRVQNVQITDNIPDLFATIIIIGLLGIALNSALVWFDKKFVFWRS